MAEQDTFTEDEVKELMRQFTEQKSNVHSFFTKIIQNPSTIKTGNVNEDELGLPKLPLRSLKELELFCRDIEDNKLWSDFFEKSAEIITSTSLSKDAILLKLSVTQKKELADITPKRKKNRGWFRRKGDSTED